MKRFICACGVILASSNISAQIPVPLLDSGSTADGKDVVQGDIGKQLEILLQCKSKTDLKTKTVESQFQAVVLVKDTNIIFVPSRSDLKPSLFSMACAAPSS